ncbi:MAG: NAD(P)-dependent oxidoreductase [Leptolyngbyaceae bacterium]|nr:NAD(P)-dependent oxidoreductase [Leptolyngbyaceae bacterium]
MDRQRIFITGASGCIGQYIVEQLVQQTPHELFLLVRNPDKLQVDCSVRQGIHVLQGDLQHIDDFAEVLATIDTAILTAAAWGDPAITFDINVTKTLALMDLLDGERCRQVIYFSTASLLGHDNQPLEEAGIIGTDYIRTKYICHQRLSELAIAPKITTVYPTLVFGGDGTKPYSHLSGGLADVMKWVWLIRFFKVDGSFHFVHAQDIAQVIAHLVEHPPEPGQSRDLVLGNPALTANEAIRELCAYFQKRIYFQVPLVPLADIIIKLFRIQMAEWDRFCMEYRHFSYKEPLSPATFNQPVYCESIGDLMNVHGLPSHPMKKHG